MAAEERVDRLAAMFSEIDRPTLAAVLEAHNGDLQAAASFLLDGALEDRALARPTTRTDDVVVVSDSKRRGTPDALPAVPQHGAAPPPPTTAAVQSPMQQPQPPQAPPSASEQDLGPQPAMQEYRIQTTLSKGWLEKQSGGKTGMSKKSLGDKLRKWDVRFFVLTFDAIYYFKYEEDFLAGRPAKGRIMLDKNMFFLEVDQNGDHMLHFRSLARVFKARCEGPTQFVWWGDVMRAAYIVQLRTWSAAEVDEWVQLIGCNQTDLFSTRNVDGSKLLGCKAREDLHKLLGLTGAHAGPWRQDADRVYNTVMSWRTAGSRAKLESMKDHLANVGSRRNLRDYEAATQYVIAKCIETVQFEGAPGGADSVTAPGSKPTSGSAGGASQSGHQAPGQAAVDTSMSHAIEYLTCGWLEKQSGGHTELGGSQKRKLTFGQAILKWDIRFCVLELDPVSYDFRLNYYRNQEEWQARMPPKGSVGVGLAQVELLRSMQEPVDYRMTIRTRDRLFSFRASLKDLKLWIATIRTATLCSAATWSSQELATFVALSGVTEDCINAIIQSNMDSRKIIMCRTVHDLLPVFGLTPEDLQASSPKYLLAKDVEKTFDLFDRYRMYASTGRLRDALAGLQSVDGLRDLSDVEVDQQARFRFVLQMTDPTQGPSATEIVRQAAAAAEPEPQQQPSAGADPDADEQDFSSEEEWDAFQAPPMPENPPDQIVPPGMTAGGLARRRASLAPQPTLPEVDHQLNRKVLTVSGAPSVDAVAEEEEQEEGGDYGHFMAAVEDDV